MSNEFMGKVAIVSGGESGIGAETTVAFAVKTSGGLHLAFNNAGIVGPEKHVGELTPEG